MKEEAESMRRNKEEEKEEEEGATFAMVGFLL